MYIYGNCATFYCSITFPIIPGLHELQSSVWMSKAFPNM